MTVQIAIHGSDIIDLVVENDDELSAATKQMRCRWEGIWLGSRMRRRLITDKWLNAIYVCTVQFADPREPKKLKVKQREEVKQQKMGVEKQVVQAGTGPKPVAGQKVTVHCTGFGKNGDLSKKFWSTKDPGQEPFTFKIGQGSVIKGTGHGLTNVKQLNKKLKSAAGRVETHLIERVSHFHMEGPSYDAQMVDLIMAKKEKTGRILHQIAFMPLHFQSVDVVFPSSCMRIGWDEGVMGMQVGEVARLQCSPDYAYGPSGFPAWGIQPNSVLVFEIEVLSLQ
ncbi:hypothetical protein HHK36_030728 [Tetracentron sinense]|uniref:peptidylprolyl isomerase n=2 Tax=Magnoliopsida TaxID=3398 RepID=A0A835D0X5_TETSI|nr:hypothetical protein HHK36_030728 [Tetracentron sinense]